MTLFDEARRHLENRRNEQRLMAWRMKWFRRFASWPTEVDEDSIRFPVTEQAMVERLRRAGL